MYGGGQPKSTFFAYTLAQKLATRVETRPNQVTIL